MLSTSHQSGLIGVQSGRKWKDLLFKSLMTWQWDRRGNVEVITAFNNLNETVSMWERWEDRQNIFYFDYVLVFSLQEVEYGADIPEKSKLKAAQRESKRQLRLQHQWWWSDHATSILGLLLAATNTPAPFFSERIYQVEIFSPAFFCVFCHLFLFHGRDTRAAGSCLGPLWTLFYTFGWHTRGADASTVW